MLFYRSIDANWCEGEAQGQIGLYPISYVEVGDTNSSGYTGYLYQFQTVFLRGQARIISY